MENKNNRTILICATFLAFFFFINGCSQGKVEESKEEEKFFSTVGKIVQIDSVNKKIKISHNDIDGFMAAMEMWFEMRDSNIIQKVKQLKRGDKVQFTFSRRGWNPAVIRTINQTHNSLEAKY